MKLSEYQYKIECLKGEHNLIADALSRSPVESEQHVDVASLNVFGIKMTTDWIAALQKSDDEVTGIITKIELNDPTTRDKYIIENGRLYRITEGRWRLYLPADLRYDVVSTTHRELVHLGVDKTLSKVKENFYFPKMREFVTKYVNRCIHCMFYKVPKKGDLYWHPLDKGNEPFQVIHLDHVGPFVLTERDNKYILTIVDGFSKYVVLRAVKDVTATETVYFVREYICTYGRPERIITDRGTAFTAAAFERFCHELNINHIKIASKSPRSNGQAEIINGIAIKCLAMATEHPDNVDWDLKSMEVQWGINNSKHRITGCVPSDVVYRHKMDNRVDDPLSREVSKLNAVKCKKDSEINPTEALRKNRESELQKNISKKEKTGEVSKGEHSAN